MFLIYKFGNFSIKVVALCLIHSQNTEVLEAGPPAITDYCCLKYYLVPTMWRRKNSLEKDLCFFFSLNKRSDPKLRLPFSSLSTTRCKWHQSLNENLFADAGCSPMYTTGILQAPWDMTHTKNTELSSDGWWLK